MELMRNSEDSYEFFLSGKDDGREICFGIFQTIPSEKQPTSSNVTLTNNMINCRKIPTFKKLVEKRFT